MNKIITSSGFDALEEHYTNHSNEEEEKILNESVIKYWETVGNRLEKENALLYVKQFIDEGYLIEAYRILGTILNIGHTDCPRCGCFSMLNKLCTRCGYDTKVKYL